VRTEIGRPAVLDVRRRTSQVDNSKEARTSMSILWIILIVVLVLALLGFFSRGYW
jgi:flagellar basal body-associated protein FliL